MNIRTILALSLSLMLMLGGLLLSSLSNTLMDMSGTILLSILMFLVSLFSICAGVVLFIIAATPSRP